MNSLLGVICMRWYATYRIDPCDRPPSSPRKPGNIQPAHFFCSTYSYVHTRLHAATAVGKDIWRLASNPIFLEEVLMNEPLSRPGIRWLFLAFIYFVMASASFSGFFTKWQFREDMPVL